MRHQGNDTLDTDVSWYKVAREIDQAIREANRVAIQAATGSLTKNRVLRVAAAVSQLRARYLAEIVKLGDTDATGNIHPTTVLNLREMREAYEEALQGFDALRHAMERAYTELEGD